MTIKKQHAYVLLLMYCFSYSSLLWSQDHVLDQYNIQWSTPSVNSQGSMPMGNGDIGVNAWVEKNGDLLFYLSKTDAWSENGQLMKLGKIKVSLTPNPQCEHSFSQELNLRQGELIVNYCKARIRLWVDANHPTVQVDIYSREPVDALVSLEIWRKKKRPIKGEEAWVLWDGDIAWDENCRERHFFQEADIIDKDCKDYLSWYHHNTYSLWKENLDLQALDINNHTDPLTGFTFGGRIVAEGMAKKQDTLLVSKNPSKHFQINIYPLTEMGTPKAWKKQMDNNIRTVKNISAKERLREHNNWWQRYWDRHHISLSSQDKAISERLQTVNQSYILQHFINACSGRGNSPIKFNGSIFTVDTYNWNGAFKGLDADFRCWGGPYWWQNTRLPYWSMLVSGDFDLMQPLFKMYREVLPVRKEATKKYYGHDGAFFPETMNFWGTYATGDYGCDRTGLADGYTVNPYVRYYWQSGLELSLMMLDYYSFTRDEDFAKNTLVPLVSEVLTFYNQHWKRGDDGKILFSPAMALETYHSAINPLVEIVGIKTVAQKILELPGSLTRGEQRSQWKNLMGDLPEIPFREVNGETVLAPAYEYYDKKNVENPELYAVFPYRRYGVGKPDLEMARKTFAIRVNRANEGWQQNSIKAAYLGLAGEAGDMVMESFSKWNREFRFPVFWGPNYDWVPDQDHGSVAMIALQRMLIQYEGEKIYLFPAWPKGWDVDFKLYAPGNTTIEGKLEKGKLIDLRVFPKERTKNIINCYSGLQE